MYLLIENFNSGLDSRRMALTSKPGTLQELTNAHITRGGEIEKRKAFSLSAVADIGTFGLHAANGSLWTFGTEVGLSGNTLGFLPGPDPNNIVPRINYMQLASGGYSARLTLNPFAFRMWRSNTIRQALACDIPSGGLTPAGAYSQLYIHFGTGGPASGMYYVNVMKNDISGNKKLLIYPGYTDTYPFTTVTVPSETFASYKGQIEWSATNSSARTTATKCELVDVIAYNGAPASGAHNYGNIDGFYVLNKKPSSEVKPCTLLCHTKQVTQSNGTFSYDFYECLFISGQSNCPISSEIFGVFTTSMIESLGYKYGVNGGSVQSIVSSPIFFFPSVSSSASSTVPLTTQAVQSINWDLYKTHNDWCKFMSRKIADAVNPTTSTHGFYVSTGDTFVTLQTNTLLPNAGGTASGWDIGLPFVSNPTTTGFNDSSIPSAAKLSEGSQISKILSTDNFKGKIYVIAEFMDGSVRHFYNGTQVSSWDAIAKSSGDANSVAAELASVINKDGLYSSTNSGNKVYIQFVNKNKNYAVSVRTSNGGLDISQAISVSTTPADVDSPQLTVLTVTGLYEQYDFFTVVIDGEDYSVQAGSSVVGKFCRTHSDKMYSTSGSLLYFSETSTNGGPAAFSNDTEKGAGVINLSSQDSGGAELTSLALYQGKLAVFSENSVQIWTMNADPKLNTFTQVLNNVGTSSPRSVVSLGNIDTYFLSPLGVRSLRARDASNVAIVSDVGNAIDDIIISDMRELTQDQRRNAVGMIDPIDGRYWLCVGPKIYVYSYFPGSNINAWSIYRPTTEDGFPIEIESICSLNQRIYARSGNDIYAYGGFNGGKYDASEVVVTMPYLDGGKPGHFKTLTAIDSACVGEWDVYSGMDIMVPETRDYIGKISNSTYSMGRISATGIGTHVGIQMRSTSNGYAKIGNFAVHFEINDAG